MAPKSRPVTIGLVQHACGDDLEGNVRKTMDGIREAARRGAQIVCTQELFRSRYFCQSETHDFFDLAEEVPGPTTQRLAELAKELGVVIVGSLFERRTAGIYHNTAVVLDADGTYLGKYRKTHIPDDPLYYEKFYFTPGDLGYRAFKTKFATIGVLICWDQWYPEAARITALHGAEILFYPTAIGWHESERETQGDDQHTAWETVQRGHAVANGLFVCAANRVGREGTVDFWGQSFISGPQGQLLHRADNTAEEVIVHEIDLAKVEETRRFWPFLRDRRIDNYEGITKRFLD